MVPAEFLLRRPFFHDSFVTIHAMLFIVVIACIVSLLGGTLLMVRGSLLAGRLVVLLLTCCFGPHFCTFEFHGVTLTLDRIGWLVSAARPWNAVDRMSAGLAVTAIPPRLFWGE